MRSSRPILLLRGFVLLACVLTGAGGGRSDARRSGSVQKDMAEPQPADASSASSPLRVTKTYTAQVDLRFKGYVVKAGGDPDVIDPKFWDVQLNYGREGDTAIVPPDGTWHGYKLGPLERIQVQGNPAGRPQHEYVLTIQRPGGQPLKLAMNRWVTTNETYADFVVAQGKDNGQEFTGKTVGQTLPVNNTLYLIGEIRENAVVIKGPGDKSHELRSSGEQHDAAVGPDDDDKDGMPNDWEDKYKGTDRNKADADEDPDGDGFSNLREFLGGSNPDDPKSLPNPLQPPRTSGKPVGVHSAVHLAEAGSNADGSDSVSIPLRVTRIYRKPVDVRFRGYVVRVGGDPDVIDPKFWDVQLNYGRESQTAIVPLQDTWQGYKLGPLEKIQVPAKPGDRPRADYALTIQRPGGQAFKLVRHEWVAVNEPCADLVVTEGRDNGKTFTGVVVGQSLQVNGEQYEVRDITKKGVRIGKPIICVEPEP